MVVGGKNLAILPNPTRKSKQAHQMQQTILIHDYPQFPNAPKPKGGGETQIQQTGD